MGDSFFIPDPSTLRLIFNIRLRRNNDRTRILKIAKLYEMNFAKKVEILVGPRKFNLNLFVTGRKSRRTRIKSIQP